MFYADTTFKLPTLNAFIIIYKYPKHVIIPNINKIIGNIRIYEKTDIIWEAAWIKPIPLFILGIININTIQ